MPISVLVVDDHPLFRDGVVAALTRPGSDIQVVAECGDAEQALTQAKVHAPQVVLADILLPGRDGLWLTRRLAVETPRSRVIVVTGADDPGLVKAALEAGAKAVLSKDASAAELGAAVRAVASGGELVSAQIARLLMTTSSSGVEPDETERCLSVREREVLAHLAAGQTNRQIAEHLVVSVRTVDNHVRNIYAKIGVHDRAMAALTAARMGLVEIA